MHVPASTGGCHFLWCIYRENTLQVSWISRHYKFLVHHFALLVFHTSMELGVSSGNSCSTKKPLATLLRTPVKHRLLKGTGLIALYTTTPYF